MKISTNYQGKIFSDYINDMFNNNTYFKIPFLKWEDGSEVIITKYNDYYDEDMLRYFLKIFDVKYPKHENGEPYSFKDVDSKVLTEHLDYYRIVLAHNGRWFNSDNEEFERAVKRYGE